MAMIWIPGDLTKNSIPYLFGQSLIFFFTMDFEVMLILGS